MRLVLQLVAPAVEGTLQARDECQCGGREYLRVFGPELPGDLDTGTK